MTAEATAALHWWEHGAAKRTTACGAAPAAVGQAVSTPVLQPISKRSGFGEIIDFNLNNEVTLEFLVPKSITNFFF